MHRMNINMNVISYFSVKVVALILYEYRNNGANVLYVDTRVINSRTCRHDESIKEFFSF